MREINNYDHKIIPLDIIVQDNFPFIAQDFDSLTLYEKYCKIVDYLNKVITKSNLTSDKVSELSDLVNDIENYVNNYFDNLDVQAEINNKLDQMASSGQLQEIIGSYLQVASLLSFDDVNDMKESDNITNGSYAQTLGFNNFNDGGSQKYKIIQEISATDVNGMTKINIGRDNLYAVSVNDIINVKKYGAYGDGIHDDTEIIQFCVDNFPHHTIYFPSGTYLISEPIDIKCGNAYQVNLYLEDNAIIKTNTIIDSLVNIGKTFGENWNRYAEGNQVIISGGIWDCNNTTYGIYSNGKQKSTKLINLNLLNVDKYGIYIDRGENVNVSNDTLINGCRIQGVTSASSNASTGIYIYGCDNTLSDITILKTKVGIDFRGGGDKVNNIHVCTSFDTITKEQYENTIAYNFSGNGGGIEMLNNIYADTFGVSFKINTPMHIVLNNFCTYYWYSDKNLVNKVFDINAEASLRLRCSNGIIQLPSTKLKNIILDMENAGVGFREYFGCYSITFDFDNLIYDINNIEVNDYINVCQLRKVEGLSLVNPWSVTMEQNKYYPIALVNKGYHQFNYRHDNTVMSEININVQNTISNSTISHKNLNGYSSVINLALLDAGITDIDNRPLLVVAAYCTTTGVSLNPSISNIQRSWSNCLYTKEYLPTYLNIDNPTVIATTSLLND